MYAEIAKELEDLPRGSLNQDMYRTAYEQARLNPFGAHPEIGQTPEDAHAAALRAVREEDPTFVPVPK